MTMPFERTRAVLQTREFLQWMLSAEATLEMFKQAKREARTLLRHYPSSIDLHLAHLACPMWFGPTLERKGPMPPDEVERLITDLDSGAYDGQARTAQDVGPAPLERFSDVKQLDVRAWAKRKGIKLPKR
jgi:hypothetical protein